jgi:RHS repeat-associated protein
MRIILWPLARTDYVSNAEGRLRTAAGVGTYEYFIKDQQGNVRVSFENVGGVATVRQENSYYAFGMVHNATINVTDANKRLYNGGSEWQDDFDDDPDLMNTFFRQYDAALGRFNAIDPVAEQTAELNGYSFAFNDPVMFNDPSGAYPDPPYGYNGDPRYYPPGAYRNTTLEEDWYNRSFDGWLRDQYYSTGMGYIYEQMYRNDPFYGYTKQTVGYIDIGTREKVAGSPLDAVGINRVTIYEYVKVDTRNPFAAMNTN